MPGLPRNRIFFLIGFAVLLLVWCLYYFYFIYDMAREIPMKAVHIIKFLFIVLTYGIGLWGLGRNRPHWILRAWHVVYGMLLLALIFLGIYDWMLARPPLSIRMLADEIQEFLISPLLYVVLGILAGAGGAITGSYRKGL
jgi:hypothetical protein